MRWLWQRAVETPVCGRFEDGLPRGPTPEYNVDRHQMADLNIGMFSITVEGSSPYLVHLNKIG